MNHERNVFRIAGSSRFGVRVLRVFRRVVRKCGAGCAGSGERKSGSPGLSAVAARVLLDAVMAQVQLGSGQAGGGRSG